MRVRAGISLTECMVALALGSVVTSAAATTLAGQARLLRAMMAQQADAEAVRVTAGVLRDELRWLDAATDIHGVAGDSMAFRVLRGSGIVCGATASELHVRYVGMRLPDATKDSILVLTARASHAAALQGAEPGGSCTTDPSADDPAADPVPTGEGVPFRLRLGDAADATDATLVAVFESGVYFVRDAALRYRLGREGRQPLTDERFATRGPPVALDRASSIAIVPLAWPPVAERPADTVRVTLVNRP